jgi:hypothetical protein
MGGHVPVGHAAHEMRACLPQLLHFPFRSFIVEILEDPIELPFWPTHPYRHPACELQSRTILSWLIRSLAGPASRGAAASTTPAAGLVVKWSGTCSCFSAPPWQMLIPMAPATTAMSTARNPIRSFTAFSERSAGFVRLQPTEAAYHPDQHRRAMLDAPHESDVQQGAFPMTDEPTLEQVNRRVGNLGYRSHPSCRSRTRRSRNLRD